MSSELSMASAISTQARTDASGPPAEKQHTSGEPFANVLASIETGARLPSSALIHASAEGLHVAPKGEGVAKQEEGEQPETAGLVLVPGDLPVAALAAALIPALPVEHEAEAQVAVPPLANALGEPAQPVPAPTAELTPEQSAGQTNAQNATAQLQPVATPADELPLPRATANGQEQSGIEPQPLDAATTTADTPVANRATASTPALETPGELSKGVVIESGGLPPAEAGAEQASANGPSGNAVALGNQPTSLEADTQAALTATGEKAPAETPTPGKEIPAAVPSPEQQEPLSHVASGDEALTPQNSRGESASGVSAHAVDQPKPASADPMPQPADKEAAATGQTAGQRAPVGARAEHVNTEHGSTFGGDVEAKVSGSPTGGLPPNGEAAAEAVRVAATPAQPEAGQRLDSPKAGAEPSPELPAIHGTPEPALASAPPADLRPATSAGEVQGRQAVTDIVRGVRAGVSNGVGHLHVRLDPPELGRIELNLTVRSGEAIRLVIETQTDAARQLIESNLDQLRQALSRHGHADVSVDVRSQSQEQTRDNTRRHSPRHHFGAETNGVRQGTFDPAGYRLSRGRALEGGRLNTVV